MSFEQQIVTLQEVERYRTQARAMQSRETARLVRRLFGLPARLLGRAGSMQRETSDQTGHPSRPKNVRHA